MSAMLKSAQAERVLVIEPGRAEKRYWADLWSYRELFFILAWRDVSVRYKQTVIGFAWAVLKPLLTMVIFTIIFGKLAKLPTEGTTPYPLLVLSGMLPWLLFSSALSDASNSIVGSAGLMSKVYFPRAIVPIATVITSLVDFLISVVLLILLMFHYHYMPSWRIVFLPLFIVMAVLASLGPGLWLTGLNVKYRDFRHIVPFLVQLGVYVSPVGFSSRIVPAKWQLLYSLNPMAGVIDGFRWSLFGNQSPLRWQNFLVSLAVVVGFMWFGVSRFRKTERSFADLA